ncbi:chromate efflux transporter [Jiella sonneratiae]|uniref:Chromate efflux transporter n=1 Tax=Jiella sonneratiae TaxID=2816856 RepID=A0ABS3J3E1_9HYPH|nr:chromate efflux transporter [Jiella sonneratiae]MBO0904179.1 chromate efflux transporter [Jiella sonneratiae]
MQRVTDAAKAGVSIAPVVPFGEATRTFARIACLSFGGPAGQIAVMHRILVEEKRWIDEDRFLHALNFCMLLPGPEAQQLATYCGWLLHRVAGGLVAGLLFVLPGFLAIMALSIVYAAYGEVGLVAAALLGLKAAVLAIVLQAVSRIGGRALKNRWMVGIAALAFTAISVFGVPFPLIVASAGLLGFASRWIGGPAFGGSKGGDAGRRDAASREPNGTVATPAEASGAPPWRSAPREGRSALFAAGACLLAWLLPVAGLLLFFGRGNVYAEIAVFFSKMAVVTFGGAYAVLAYVAQEAVGTHGWLRPGEMLDGLGLAETTPGPLIMVTQFVGYLAAFRAPGSLDPYLAGALGACLTTWVTFAPCFLWIFAGAPHVEALRGNRALSAALSAITAAVVGVILNLAVWFALHVLFSKIGTVHWAGLSLAVPVPSSLEPLALALFGLAAAAVFVLRWGVLSTLALCVVASIGASALPG